MKEKNLHSLYICMRLYFQAAHLKRSFPDYWYSESLYTNAMRWWWILHQNCRESGNARFSVEYTNECECVIVLKFVYI